MLLQAHKSYLTYLDKLHTTAAERCSMVVSGGRLPVEGHGQHRLHKPFFCKTADSGLLYNIWSPALLPFFNTAGFILPIFIQFAFCADSINWTLVIHTLPTCVWNQNLKNLPVSGTPRFHSNKNQGNQRTVPLFGSLRAIFLFIYLLFKKQETNQSNLSFFFFFFLNVFPCSLCFFCSSNNFGRFCFESSEVNSGGQAP